jgi:hypothetical protein
VKSLKNKKYWGHLEKEIMNKLDPGEDYLPYAVEPKNDNVKNKHIGSSFDDFLKTNNIELKRDINWALKMLDHDKIVYRESNPKVIIYPKSSNISNLNLKISAEDLFAEDWLVFIGKSFKDILEDLYAGKTIRRKGWHDLLNIGKYGPNKILSLDDLYANDWEIVDIVAEVDEIQKNIKENRFEDK